MGEPDGKSDSVRNYYFFSSAIKHFVSFLIRMKYRKRERAGWDTERKKEEERVETKQEEKIEK